MLHSQGDALAKAQAAHRPVPCEMSAVAGGLQVQLLDRLRLLRHRCIRGSRGLEPRFPLEPGSIERGALILGSVESYGAEARGAQQLAEAQSGPLAL